ncbi:hypothetical protein ACA910_020634 [Epithemia clementina (nom. ined.)]
MSRTTSATSGGETAAAAPHQHHHNASTVQSVESQGSGPNRGTGTAFYQSDLERKLELLEVRFSQPLPNHHHHHHHHQPQNSRSPSAATMASDTTASCQRSISSRSPTGGSPTATMAVARAHIDSQQHHSFGFDSPASNNNNNNINNAGNNRQSLPGSTAKPLLQTRSKRASMHRRSSSLGATTPRLDLVRQAADRQMQKVAATTTVALQQHDRFLVASSSCSEVSSESSTRQLHNRSTGRDNHHDHRVLPLPPAAINSAVTTVDSPALTTPPLPPQNPSRKRKSVPVKVEVPSVKETFQNDENDTCNKRNKSLHAGSLQSVQRTLTNLKNGSNTFNTLGTSTRGAPGKLDVDDPSSHQSKAMAKTNFGNSMSKGIAAQRALSIIVNDDTDKATVEIPLQEKDPSVRDQALSMTPRRQTSKKALTSPRRQSSSASHETLESKKPVTRLQHRTLQNNSTLYDFFSVTSAPLNNKRRKASTKDKPPTLSSENPGDLSSEHVYSIEAGALSPRKASHRKMSADAAEVDGPPMDLSVQKRIEELEKTCRDQEEQLKAVANNRTILHTALQSALDQREKEMKALKEKQAAWQSRSQNVLEEYVRAEATRSARLVREQLASDGARLGRLVYSRAGIRSAAVENWEEGHAICSLVQRKNAWKEKRKRLEQRYREAQKVAQQWLSPSKAATPPGEDRSPSKNSQCRDDGRTSMGEWPLVQSKMDAVQAVESARFHLENLRKEERELLAEEQKLNDEKGAHIRALKRVASEDASRFRTCLKMHGRYVLKCLLGKGGFSEVWRAFDLLELREVAVKIHQLDPRWSESKKENYTKHVSREYEIHRNVRHPRIVSLFDVFEIDNNSFATVLEFCEGTDLDTMLKEKRRLPERDAKSILLQILSGMQYLSQPSDDGTRQGIIHYDLKPGNILFDEFGDAKITDFGLSKIVDAPDPSESMELTSQGVGTYWYLPPECFVTDETVRISNKVDVWSIGVIFYQMLFGKRPFGDGQTQDAILSNRTMLNAHQVPFPDKPQVSEECKTFIRNCLSYDQTFRPTIAQICEHSYVTKTTSSKKEV